MKVLTLWQPYAEAVKREVKTYETRNWSTPYRGPLVIHAAKRPYTFEDVGFNVASFMFDHHMNRSEMAFGAAICVVTLADCIRMTPEFIARTPRQELIWGDWQPGRYAWKVQLVKVFDEPISLRGQQGLWDWQGALP